MICQPAWQLPISTACPRLPDAVRHRLDETRLGAAHVLDGLAGHRVGQEADEIARMAGLQRDADLAIVLHAADAGAWPARGSNTMNGRLAGSIATPAGGMMRTRP